MTVRDVIQSLLRTNNNLDDPAKVRILDFESSGKQAEAVVRNVNLAGEIIIEDQDIKVKK